MIIIKIPDLSNLNLDTNGLNFFNDFYNDDKIDNIDMRQFYGKSTGAEEFSMPVLLQAADDSTSVFLGMVADQAAVTFDATDSLQIILHIER